MHLPAVAPPAVPARRSTRSAALAATLLLSTTFLAFTPPPAAAAGPHEWTPLNPIYGGSLGRGNPIAQIQEDASGNRMAVWYDFATQFALFASLAPAGGEWTPPIPITAQVESGILGFDFAMGASGDAVVGWLSQYNLANSYTRYSVDAALFRPGSGWTYAMTVSVDDIADGFNPGRASAPAVDIDDAGESVIVWTQTIDYLGSNETDVYAARHSGTWINFTTPEVLDTLPYDPDLVDVAATEGGTDIAVWRQVDGANRSLYSSAYEPGAGWSAAEPRENSTENVELLTVGAGAPGQAVLVWSQGPPGEASVFGSTYAEGSWKAGEPIDSVAAPHGVLSVAANAGGAAVATWTLVTYPTYSIRGATYDPSAGWQASGELEGLSWYPFATAPGIDAEGNALFLWMGIEDVYYGTVNAKRYVNGTGWLASEQVLPRGNAPEDLVVSPDGHASAAIRHFDGTSYRPYEVRYLPADILPPALEVTAPLDGATSSSNFVTVRGVTEPGASLWINGAPTYVDENGSFEAIAELGAGSVTVTVLARDAAGNEATVSRSVTVDARDDQLNASLAALEASVAALEAAINATGGGSDPAVWSAINATRDDLSALESAVIAARAQLNATEAEANQAGSAAARAESAAGAAGAAMAAGVAGAALGAAGLATALMRRPGAPGAPEDRTNMHPKEKGSRTKSEAGEPAETPEAEELRVKEKGNRTK